MAAESTSTWRWTAAALVCFAANSVLCRSALVQGAIDAASFTSLRLLGGAAALFFLVRVCGEAPKGRPPANHWGSGLALFTYAACFSFAYLELTTATGALLLFAAVQVTMVLGGILGGERPTAPQWLGLSLALGGLGYLVAPGLEAPPLRSAVLMLVAGASWGVYSLRGRNVTRPLVSTTATFYASVPMTLLLSASTADDAWVSVEGLVLALASGAIASGLGYVFWYGALPRLSAAAAASVQLLVPVLAAVGGLILLAELPSRRLLFASVAILGGIFLTTRRPNEGGFPASGQAELEPER